MSSTNTPTFLIVKFFVPEHLKWMIPDAIPKYQPSSRASIAGKDERPQPVIMADMLGLKKLAKFGRLRPGHFDTGEHSGSDEHVSVASLFRGLNYHGFEVTSVTKKHVKERKRYEIWFFVSEVPLSGKRRRQDDDIWEGLDKTILLSKWIAHVWDNTETGNPYTINLVQPRKCDAAYKFVVDTDEDGTTQLKYLPFRPDKAPQELKKPV